MATIGSFTRKQDGSFEGSLATLTMQVCLRLVPLEEDLRQGPRLPGVRRPGGARGSVEP